MPVEPFASREDKMTDGAVLADIEKRATKALICPILSKVVQIYDVTPKDVPGEPNEDEMVMHEYELYRVECDGGCAAFQGYGSACAMMLRK